MKKYMLTRFMPLAFVFIQGFLPEMAAQSDEFVLCDTTDALTYRAKGDTMFIGKPDPPLTGDRFIFTKESNLTDSEYNDLRIRVFRAFTPQRFNYLAQQKEPMTIWVYIDGAGNVKEVSFSIYPPSVITFDDFRNINAQLKGAKVNMPPAYPNWPYTHFPVDLDFASDMTEYNTHSRQAKVYL
jgi:hypothetical protein